MWFSIDIRGYAARLFSDSDINDGASPLNDRNSSLAFEYWGEIIYHALKIEIYEICIMVMFCEDGMLVFLGSRIPYKLTRAI